MDEFASKPTPPRATPKDDPAASGVIPADKTAAIAVGTVLDGKYLVCRLAGTGAFGLVYEAQNIELEEKVAIKCLRPEMMADKAMVARFAREAKAAAAIKCEHAARVFDVGSSGGVPFIVMEYLEGKDLGTILQETGGIGPRMAVEYALQICEALAVAHSKGIVHRDIKPENLLLVEKPGGLRVVKVLDFGISKVALTKSILPEAPIVKTTNMMGTPLYMSPEQIRSSVTVDIRSDIWSLGMVLYEILGGEPAFKGESITEICAAVLETEPTPIEQLRPDLAPGLATVIHTCLEKDVNLRYQNVAELALALMPFGPKRTRLNVERTVTTLQAAGMLDPSVEVHSIVPAPPSSSGLGEFSMSPLPPPPKFGSGPHGPQSAPRSGPPSGGARNSASVEPVAASVEPTPALIPTVANAPASVAPPPRRIVPIVIGLAVVGLAIVGVIAIGLGKRDANTTTTPAPTKSAPVAVTTPAAPTPPPTPTPAPTPAPTETAATPVTTLPSAADPTSTSGLRPDTPTRAPMPVVTNRPRASVPPQPQPQPQLTAQKPTAAPAPPAASPSAPAQPTTTQRGRTFPRDL